MPDNVLIDVDDALKRVMNNANLYVKLLTKFKNENNLNDLESALAENNMESAKNAAHTLKGLAANLSLMELRAQCLEMENQIKAGNINPNQINILKEVFSNTLNEIEKVIAQYGK